MADSKKSPNLLPVVALAAALAVIGGLMLFRLNAMGYFSKAGHLPEFGTVPEFKLTERSGRDIERAGLDGRVWAANFIFTRCPGPCPMMSVRAQELTRALPDLTMVSFTSDPEFDTPEVLAKYAVKYKANPKQWLFLTGPKAEMSRIAKEFKFGGIDQPDMHSTRFVLVDGKAQIRGYYDSNDPEALARLRRDAQALLN